MLGSARLRGAITLGVLSAAVAAALIAPVSAGEVLTRPSVKKIAKKVATKVSAKAVTGYFAQPGILILSDGNYSSEPTPSGNSGVIESFTLPFGEWLITATLNFHALEGNPVIGCTLGGPIPGGAIPNNQMIQLANLPDAPPTIAYGSMALQSAVSVTGSSEPVQIACFESGGESEYRHVRISAIKGGAVQEIQSAV